MIGLRPALRRAVRIGSCAALLLLAGFVSHATVGEVAGVRFCSGPKECLAWSPVAGASAYHVYRGELASLGCLLVPAMDSCSKGTFVAETTGAALVESPASGSFFWYLVTADDSAVEGPPGDASQGPRVRNGAASCGSVCAPAGAACASGSDCCGANCLSGVCQSACCQPASSACTSALQCCSGACTNGVCAAGCAPSGALCNTTDDCCSGTCSGGTCQALCTPEGGACTSTSQCCAGTCANQACSDPGGPSHVGQWSAVHDWPLVAIHLTLLRTGEILLWDGHTEEEGTYLWNPATGAFTFFPPTAVNLFCSSHTALGDGRLLVGGGTGEYSGIGLRDTKLFTPVSNSATNGPLMAFPRYYPSLITLGNGKVLALSGTDDCDTTCLVETPEVYDPVANSWTALSNASLAIPYYPRAFVLPDGRVVTSGASEASTATRALDVSSQTWTTIDSRILHGGTSALYLPGKVLMGGLAASPESNAASVATTYVLDMTQPSPAWREVAPMAYPRTHHNFTLLPDGTVLVTGGSRSANSNNTSQAVFEAEIWSPVTETWTTAAGMQVPRQYHSTALLLPDGRVLSAGGGRTGEDELSAEIYSPPYLFRGPRPAITTAPSTIRRGDSFFVGTPDASSIGKVALLRLGSVTHGFNFDQNHMPLAFAQAQGGLTVQAPASSASVPPGYYMLFVVRTNGVPSVGQITRIPGPSSDAVPPATPSGLSAQVTSGDIRLTWNAATDNVGVVGYNVHRATTQGFQPTSANRIAGATATTLLDTALPGAGLYAYVVTAEDAAGNLSNASNESQASLASDESAPLVPDDVGAVPLSPTRVDVAWSASSDDVGVAGYNLFRDGLHVASVSSLFDRDIGLAGGATYAYSVSAYDAAGNASDPSSTVEVTTPASVPNLLAAYDFDEGSGTALNDVSGHAYDGIPTGGATWSAGKRGSGLAFNGATSRVDFGNVFNSLAPPCTVEAWVYPQGTNSGELTILATDDGSVYAGIFFYLEGSNLKLGVDLGDGWGLGPTHRRSKSGTTSLPQNAWTHVAAVVRGPVDISLYVNGVDNGGTYSGSASFFTHNQANATIGKYRSSYFIGRIDEVRVYDRALTSGEVQTDMGFAPLELR